MIWRSMDSLPLGTPIIVSDGCNVYALIANERDKRTGYICTSPVGWSGADMCPDFQLEDMTKWANFPLPK